MMNRRGFFDALIRYLLLAAIALVSGMAWRNSRLAAPGSCPPHLACASCSLSSRCNLPKNKPAQQPAGTKLNHDNQLHATKS